CTFFSSFLSHFRVLRDLHSFPTRRSSDLTCQSGRALVKRGSGADYSLWPQGRGEGAGSLGICRRIKALRSRTSSSGELAERSSGDRKSTRLNSSHVAISYAVFCLKKKTKK